tara:strand:+ start:145 stop:693 length:549 start_codon:yes stop_codon:yes gene_type:complete
MRSNYLVKLSPLIFLLTLIIILFVSNNKQNTNLKILIWQTPTLSLGSYLAISSCSGVLLSYIITFNFARFNQPSLKREIKYPIDPTQDKPDKDILNNIYSYDNTLIERDVKDPSPTINANFRIISREASQYFEIPNNKQKKSPNSKFEYHESDYEKSDKRKSNKNNNKDTYNDWEDESFIKW